MKGRQDPPRSTQSAQRLYSHTAISVIRAIRGLHFSLPMWGMGSIVILILGGMLLNADQVVAATITPTASVEVVVNLSDASEQPLAGVIVTLLLNRYSHIIEEIRAGSCVTDATGFCILMVSDPPRLASGHIEGILDLGAYGSQLIGWQADRVEISLQLYPDGKLATISPPLDAPYEGQTEQPTDAPRTTSAITLIRSATSTFNAISPTSTAIFIFPTATVTPVTTATRTLQLTLPAPVQPSPQPQKSGWAWIALGLALFFILGAAWVITTIRQYKPKKSG